jgi:hypothetical protein
MSYHFLPTPTAEQAAQQYSFAEAPGVFDRVGTVAIKDVETNTLTSSTVSFTRQALAMLTLLNDFDLSMVLQRLPTIALSP